MQFTGEIDTDDVAEAVWEHIIDNVQSECQDTIDNYDFTHIVQDVLQDESLPDEDSVRDIVRDEYGDQVSELIERISELEEHGLKAVEHLDVEQRLAIVEGMLQVIGTSFAAIGTVITEAQTQGSE